MKTVSHTCNCGSNINIKFNKSKYIEKVCPGCGAKYKFSKDGRVEIIHVKRDRK